ncbi:hypothetical protein RJT34_00551 [Clitoria ternatea]|uniref:Phloem protein 2 n=1 Tax=Clitoria ternatea TaxID=43366 RepID=A0AAN9Q2S7_CLITE
MIEVAELKEVYWLQVCGKFHTRKLSEGMLYKVCFIVRLKDSATGWEDPIILELKLPGGKTQQWKEILTMKPRERWIEILVGEFIATEKYVGEMDISLNGTDGTDWKQGLIIKGVEIKPDIQYYWKA